MLAFKLNYSFKSKKLSVLVENVQLFEIISINLKFICNQPTTKIENVSHAFELHR